MKENSIYLKEWKVVSPERVQLDYENGESLLVTKKDFDRAFGCIISCTYEEVKRDFAVDAA